MLSKIQTMRYIEDIVIFYKKQPVYNPQMTKRAEKNKRNNKKTMGVEHVSETLGKANILGGDGMKELKYPSNLISFRRVKKGMHPTQKPVALMEYLIKTYTNENQVVLDFTMGSGTTGVAAIKNKRSFIGIELDDDYFKAAQERIERETAQLQINY